MPILPASLRHTATSLFHHLLPRMAHRRAARRLAGCEPELAILAPFVDPEREAIDVGANCGLYTAALAPLANHVHAIEAHPRLARLLSGVPAANVTVHRKAMSDVAGRTVQLAVARRGGREMDGFAHLADGTQDAGDHLYAVTTATLDDFAGRPIGFVKIDVEGHEFAVVTGARKLIARHSPVFLIEAERRHRENAPFDLFRFFAARGYGGWFLHIDALRPVADFTMDLQDPAAFDRDSNAQGTSYFNNFFFLPPEFDQNQAAAQVQALLA